MTTEFKELKGKTIKSVNGLKQGSDDVTFYMTDGSRYRMFHEQD